MGSKKKALMIGAGILLTIVTVSWGIMQTIQPIPACKQEDFSQWEMTETIHKIGQEKPDEKRVFLTFDDGPSETTEKILDTLKEKQVPASFFVIAAEHNQKHLPLLDRMIKEGHSIALHTCTHDYSSIYASTASYWKDIEQLKEKIAPYLKNEPRWLRFPGGSTNTVSRKYGGSGLMKKLVQQAEEKGYLALDWNVSAEDAVGSKKSPESIVRKVISDSKGKNTCVVLMHDSKHTKSTAEALPQIIDWYREQGYRFCSLDQEKP